MPLSRYSSFLYTSRCRGVFEVSEVSWVLPKVLPFEVSELPCFQNRCFGVCFRCFPGDTQLGEYLLSHHAPPRLIQICVLSHFSLRASSSLVLHLSALIILCRLNRLCSGGGRSAYTGSLSESVLRQDPDSRQIAQVSGFYSPQRQLICHSLV